MYKFIKYVAFALITSLINISVYYLFYNYVLKSIIISNIIAYTISILVQFITNKKYVFKNNSNNYSKQVCLFLLVKLVAFGLDTMVLHLCTKIFKMGQLLAKIIANCSTTLSNYSLNNDMVFK